MLARDAVLSVQYIVCVTSDNCSEQLAFLVPKLIYHHVGLFVVQVVLSSPHWTTSITRPLTGQCLSNVRPEISFLVAAEAWSHIQLHLEEPSCQETPKNMKIKTSSKLY